MKTTVICAAIAVSLAIIQGCGGKPDNAGATKDLMAADSAFARVSLEQGAAEAFNMYLADDAIQMPAGGEPVFGRQQIYEGMIGEYSLEWEPQDGEAASSGDLGYTWGKFRFSYIDDKGDSVTSYGKYLNVWKKQADGSWKVLIDIGNKSPAPEGEQKDR